MIKKLMFGFIATAIVCSCTKTNNDLSATTKEPEITTAKNGSHCATMEVFQKQLAEDPGLAQKMENIEELTRKFINNPDAQARLLSDGTMEIPVVWNVIYRTSSENISDAQLASQLQVLNADFSATNGDYGFTPSLFQSSRSGDCKIRFVLDQTRRKYVNRTSWGTNDLMKTSTGLTPLSPTTKLNIWVVNNIVSGSSNILGYAQFPGGNPSTDGVVLGHRYVGTFGTAVSPFNKGRTATHEVGHWLNLRHIWGDATCGNDFVSDTPPAGGPNYGCPGFPASTSCSSTPMMTMNYMDYTNDACMYMFTNGQRLRMQATYAVGGPRASFR